MIGFTPAPDRLSGLWTPGSFHYAAPVPPTEVIERFRRRTRSYDRLKGRDRFGYISWLQQDRIRVWRATFWRSQPSRGALLFDARLEDLQDGPGTALTGRIRLNTAYIATVAWTAFYMLVAAVVHFPLLLIAVLAVVGLVQLTVIAISARRDTRPMVDFIEKVLTEPAPAPVN